MTGVLIITGSSETDMHTGRDPCEHEGRDGSDVSRSQGKPRIARTPRGAKDRLEQIPPCPFPQKGPTLKTVRS